MINAAYQRALEAGISVLDFWNMTFGEVIDQIGAYNKVVINKLKERAKMDYVLVGLIGRKAEQFLKSDIEMISLVDAYSFLFQEEKVESDQLKAKADMEIWKQKMISFANQHNRRRGEEK